MTEKKYVYVFLQVLRRHSTILPIVFMRKRLGPLLATASGAGSQVCKRLNCQYVNQIMLLLLSHFSRVRLCATPSLGFSRQEHWSGLPLPSPVHKSEKWKWSRSVMSDSSRPHGLQPTRLPHPWDFPGQSTGVGCHYNQERNMASKRSHKW